MKNHFRVLFLLMLGSFIAVSQPKSTKYLVFDVNGKSGLTDLSGKTIVEPEYDVIETYNDEYFLGKKSGTFSLIKINGKVVYTFKEKNIDSDYTEYEGLLVSADSALYLFNKKLKLENKIPGVERTEINSHLLTVFVQEQKDDKVLCSVNLYGIKNLKLLGSYQLVDCDGYEFKKSYNNRHKPYYKISHVLNGKPVLSVLDSTGSLMFSHALPGESANDLMVCANRNGRLFALDYPEELVNDYYKGRSVSSEVKNFYLIAKKDRNTENESWRVYNSDGKLINDFGKVAEFNAEYVNRRKDEIAFFTLTKEDSLEESPVYFIDQKFQNQGKILSEYKKENESYNLWEPPTDEKGIVMYLRNNQLVFYSIHLQKEFSAINPDPVNVYNSSGMIPVSNILADNWIVFKENNNYGVYNFRTDKRVPLFSFALKQNEIIEQVEAQYSSSSHIIEINVSVKGKKEDAEDTTFCYLLTTGGEFKKLEPKTASFYPLRAYDTISPEEISFRFPFLTDKNSIINYEGKTVLELQGNRLYCVGSHYLGLSDGKTSSLYDLNVNLINKNIPGIVCASIEGKEDLLCYDNGFYNRFKDGKLNRLFSEQELMGSDKNFLAEPDEKQMIVHVMKQENFLVMYQNVPMNNEFKMALYDLKNGQLHICPEQRFTDFTGEIEAFPALFTEPFIFASPQKENIKCFEGIYSPKIKADTLMLTIETLFNQEQLGPEFKNAVLFNSKKTSAVYFGTPDSIYFQFNSFPELGEWDCGIMFFGDVENGFYLLDTVKKQLSADKYDRVDTDSENSCDNSEFAATNRRTKKRELYKLTRNGYTKLTEGNFESFTRVVSTKDGFGRSGIFYLFYKDNKLHFVTDNKFRLLYDTTKFVAEPDGDHTTLWEANYIVLRSKEANDYYVVNGITGVVNKLSAKPVMGTLEKFRVLEIMTGDGNATLFLIETGETMQDVNTGKGEYFVFDGKLYFREYEEDNGTTHLYNSSKMKIK